MALIKCPECGKEISDSIKQCIHCGKQIIFCPDCKKLMPDTDSPCPNCGFSFMSHQEENGVNQQTKEEISIQPETSEEENHEKSAKDVLEKVKDKCIAYNLLRIVYWILCIGGPIIGVSMFIASISLILSIDFWLTVATVCFIWNFITQIAYDIPQFILFFKIKKQCFKIGKTLDYLSKNMTLEALHDHDIIWLEIFNIYDKPLQAMYIISHMYNSLTILIAGGLTIHLFPKILPILPTISSKPYITFIVYFVAFELLYGLIRLLTKLPSYILKKVIIKKRQIAIIDRWKNGCLCIEEFENDYVNNSTKEGEHSTYSNDIGNNASHYPVSPYDVAKKLQQREKIINVFWLIIGIIQCLSIIGAICGIFNIVMAVKGFKKSKEIRVGNKQIIEYYEEQLSFLIIALLINLFLGGILGIILIIFDFLIRSYALKHKYAFQA